MTIYDYSSARPDPNVLGEGVMRYLMPVGAPWPTRSVGKVIGLDEIATLHAAGKPVGLVWEVTANDSDGGYLRGLNYGAQARAMAKTLGFPDELPIYWAVDKRLNANTRALALDYGKGFTVSAGAARPYGEGALIDMAVGAGITDCGWCPSTWTMGSPNIGLLQLVQSPDVPGTDMNRALRPDWGGWHPSTGDDFMAALTDAQMAAFTKMLDDERLLTAVELTYFAAENTQNAVGRLELWNSEAVDRISDAVIAKLPSAPAGGVTVAMVKDALQQALRDGTG